MHSAEVVDIVILLRDAAVAEFKNKPSGFESELQGESDTLYVKLLF